MLSSLGPVPQLRNITAREIFSDKVNVFNAFEIGQKVIRQLFGTLVKDYSLALYRVDQVEARQQIRRVVIIPW